MTTQEYIKLHRNDDVYRLALAKAPEGVDLQYALGQIAAYQTLSKKVPSWATCDELVFPRQLSLEQSSSELTARYKAELIRQFMGADGYQHIDLTGGMGIDCYFIAQYTSHSHYVEQSSELCAIAQHNFAHLNPNISVHNTTAEEYLSQQTTVNSQRSSDKSDCQTSRTSQTGPTSPTQNPLLSKGRCPQGGGVCNLSTLNSQLSTLIYLDPARRGDHGQKLVSIADCQPNVVELLPHMFQITDRVVVKLSPMLDITRAINELPYIQHLYIISVGNECKELLLFINRNHTAETTIHAINLSQQSSDKSDCQTSPTSPTDNCALCIVHCALNNSSLLTGSLQEESALTLSHARQVGAYLYEPFAAHLKSGLYKTIAHRYGVEKLHQHSHLYTSAELNDDFPGRRFKVIETIPFDKKSAKALFKSLAKANITTRNFPLSVSELRTQYKIKDGGETYIFATTLYDDSKVLILCNKA